MNLYSARPPSSFGAADFPECGAAGRPTPSPSPWSGRGHRLGSCGIVAGPSPVKLRGSILSSSNATRPYHELYTLSRVGEGIKLSMSAFALPGEKIDGFEFTGAGVGEFARAGQNAIYT